MIHLYEDQHHQLYLRRDDAPECHQVMTWRNGDFQAHAERLDSYGALASAHKDGTVGAMTERGIYKRVHELGRRVGLDLCVHDGRHDWTTRALAGGTSIDRLQEAGGWASPTMPLRYANRGRVANEGVQLGAD